MLKRIIVLILAIVAIALWIVVLKTSETKSPSVVYPRIGLIVAFAIYLVYPIISRSYRKAKGILHLILLLAITNSISFAGNKSQVQDNQYQILVGNWQGLVNYGLMKFTLVFKFSWNEKGSFTGTLDIVEENAMGLPIDEILMRNDSLFLNMTEINRKYMGKINAEKSRIDGLYIRIGAQSLPLSIAKVETQAVMRRPQAPLEPYPYKSKSISFINKTDNVKLGGTLTLPKGKGPFPVIILISGSGAQDRDETIFGHKPFLVVADFLTRNGIAVLRYDDRGVGESMGDHLLATLEINSGDVKSAIDFLGARKDIRKKSIMLLGHSEGAIIALRIASETKNIASIILLGAPGISIEENLYLQNSLIRKAGGASDAMIAEIIEMQKLIFSAIKENKIDSLAKEKLRSIYSGNRFQALTVDQKNAIDGKISSLITPYFRDILSCNPSDYLLKVRCPLLVISGEKDLQAPPKQNFAAIEECLKLGKNKNYKVMEVPGLNHMLQTAQTGAMSEYSTIEETISPLALNEILKWVIKFR